MSLWEYKVITSGKGGFASPAMMEKFLNDLGREEWEIISFHTSADNFLAFTGLARRSTQRDWTLQDAAAAAAKAEADKLRAEFEAKFKAGSSSAPASAAEDRSGGFLEEKAAPDDGFRKPVDTSRDDEPEAAEEEKDEWDKLTASEEEELPTFFDALKPHMRRNQRGPGQSVGVDYLAKKWDQSEDDLKGALTECGFVIPPDEDAKPEYLEYDGDLYWLNINRRGELWINTKEKPRQMFRTAKGTRVEVESAPAADAKQEAGDGRPESGEKSADRAPRENEYSESKIENPEPLPVGHALLERIRPHMRRSRRGPGGSGSTVFLSRALRTNESALREAFVALGLAVPAGAADQPVHIEVGAELWWLNLDSRGGLWINAREKRDRDQAPESAPAPADAPAPAAAAPADGAAATPDPAPVENRESKIEHPPASPLAAVRLLLKETRTGSVAGKVERLAEELGRTSGDLLMVLIGAGLKVPEKPREKPVFVPLGEEILWLNRNSKDELWLNAKASKFAGDDDDGGENSDEPAPAGAADAPKPRSRLMRGGRRAGGAASPSRDE